MFALFILLSVLEILVVVLFIIMAFSRIVSIRYGAPYVPMSRLLLREILMTGDIGAGDTVYDLGSGDGRALIMSVRSLGARRAIGYEISLWPYTKSKILIRLAGLSARISVHRSNILTIDYAPADVVYMYLFPAIVQKLALLLGRSLRPGARIISPRFQINNPTQYGLSLTKQTTIGGYAIFVYTKNLTT